MEPRDAASFLVAAFFLTAVSVSAETVPRPDPPPPASATPAEPDEATRAGQWRRRRQERFGQIQPRTLRKAEALMLWIEKQVAHTLAFPQLDEAEVSLGFENSRLGDLFLDYRDYLFPQIGTVRTGSGLATGVHYRNNQIGNSPLGFEIFAGASVLRYQDYRLTFGKLPWSGFIPNVITNGLKEEPEKLFLYSDVRYQYFPDEDFFGLEGDSLEANRSDFLLERVSYHLVGALRPSPHIMLAARAGLSQIDIGPGGDVGLSNTDVLFDEGSAPGLTSPSDFFELGSSLLLDYRDVAHNPHKGVFLGLSFQRYDDLRRSQFEFNRYVVDARAYLPLGSPQRVLAMQFLTSLDDADAGSGVPFYLQRTLGGKSTLRGFRDFRFRGENLLHFSTEYRWDAAAAVELAAFYDTGKVFMDRDDYAFDDLKKSIGIGVRFKTPEAAFLRLDVARSDEDTRFYFTVGHPF